MDEGPPGFEPDSGDERPEPGILCARCGAVCDPYQEYCLECGERLADSAVLPPSLKERWQRLVPLGGRAWVVPVLVAAAVAAIATLLAILGRGNPTTTFEAVGPPVRTSTIGIETGTTAASTTGRAKPAPPPVQSHGLIAWPGRPAYTIVLASLPTTGGKEGARLKALEAVNAGLADVGVLLSSDYSSLHPGYFVVFSGVYRSELEALNHVDAARSAGFDQPYVKRVAS
jgi:hypothetical protein